MPAEYRQQAPAMAPGEPQAPIAPAPAEAPTPPAPAAEASPSPAEAPTVQGRSPAPAVASPSPAAVRDSQMCDEGPEADAVLALEVEDPAEVADLEVAAEVEGHEALVQHDLDELTAKAEKADEYLQLAQRTRADFDNYRKRAARDAAAAQERGVAKLARELLPAVDNLDRALEAAEADGSGNGDTLVSGIKLVHADVIAALARVGIERYSPKGESFDPQCHEAVAQLPVEGAQPGTIVEVYQRGYRIGENVLRPARVVVAG